MRDVFYTILVVWILWRIFSSISGYKAQQKNNSTASSTSQNNRKQGDTSVDYIPPVKKKISDDEGEYVDYEELQ